VSSQKLKSNSQKVLSHDQPQTPNPKPHILHFEIEDTGMGISPEEMDLLFTAFAQTASGVQSKEGTGLGLTISRRFVRLMGGDIVASSQPERGTTFAFEIPATLATHGETAPTASLTRIPKFRVDQPDYRLLVVEDREESRQILVTLLTHAGFQVRSAVNGREAVVLWQSWHPHLIWMDLRMPIMDGYEATKQIRRLEKNLPVERLMNDRSTSTNNQHTSTVTSFEYLTTTAQDLTISNRRTVIVALTASAMKEDYDRLLSVGCDDVVFKPFRAETIWRKLHDHLGLQWLDESRNESPDPPQNDSSFVLDSSHFKMMPIQWVSQVYAAASECSDLLVYEAIENIPQPNPILVNALKELVYCYRFDRVMELTEYARDW